MTTLTLNLTATLQSTLTAGGASNGVSAYAVYFDTNGAANFTTLVDNGTLQGTGSYVINLPTMPAGKIYFLIQSQDSSEPYDLTTLIQDQADINWANAATWGVRYDSFEFSLEGQTGDAGNLTSVESFGLPMAVEVEYQDGGGTVQATDTRGYDVSGSTFFANLNGTAPGVLYTYTDGALAGQTRMAIGPATSVVPGSGSTSFQASDWDSYIDSLQTQSGTTGVFISGFFNGAVDANNVYHNAGYYSYELTWDPTHQNLDNTTGTFWLSPTDSQVSGYSTIAGFSQIQGYIQITPDQLANSIYSTLGSAYIYSDPTDAQPYNIALSPGAMNTGANNQWGEVLTQFLTGFSAGYIGMSGASLNSGVTQPIDLSNNINWDPTYAFNQNLAGGDVSERVDPYSNLFFLNSNSYGSNYSDNLMSAYSTGGPLISLYSPYTSADVSNINLTIFDDSETPTGYVTPTIYNYINTGGGFDDAVATTSGISIGLNFFNQLVMLDDTTASLTLRFQTADGWQELELSAAANTSAGNPGSLWDDWTIVQNGDGTYSVSAGGNAQTTGSLVITNPPAPANGVAWYQIVVHDVDDPDGTAANAKTFNLYATTSNSLFVNPAYTGQAGSLAVDGLAIVAPQASSSATILTFAVDFLYAATSTIDPSLLTTNLPDALSIFNSMHGVGTLPTAAVVGDMSTGSFVAGSGQTTTTAPVAALQSGELAFGWTGYNPLAWTTNANSDPIGSSWISQYSNKIGAGNLARLTFAGTSLAPVMALGDIDGQWLSGTQNFGNGTYTATFTEYLASDTVFANPLTPVSSTLNFTVNVAEVDLLTAGSGQALALDDGGTVAGNWIRFETLSSGSGGLPPDATLILYATDASGNLVARDGTTPGVTLSEATLGKIGNVLSDLDAQLLSGSQHVYLGAGQQLRFAVQSGSGATDMAPNVVIGVHSDGTADIHIDDFRLSAVSDNTLSGGAELASGQHRYDEALVYLTHGAMIEVELTGSSANTNTLGFVRFDVDAQGNLSVDGVAYGNTDTFRAAVVDNLDPGFLVARGGQTAIDQTWTVQGSDGYYAPVLLTQSGEIFVPGAGNSGGNEYIRIFGENMFGFEDLTAAQNSDFDYNDMAMKLTPMQSIF
ncbi:hypothetical protein [Ancylobacter sp. SL191]|uniref:hypothetical protein n=1 Tax=Ancylobacter sp. SL191 TaxID=2995166 RepID=UPI0022721378|nr:hypothetical protein [Ancylobacter sp. SL191]WAC29307.1 hypothetical protein OU996_09900 [Ancylobacter sp. SL191]